MAASHALCHIWQHLMHSVIYGSISCTLSYMAASHALCHIWQHLMHSVIYGSISCTLSYMTASHALCHIWQHLMHSVIYGSSLFIKFYIQVESISHCTVNSKIFGRVLFSRNFAYSFVKIKSSQKDKITLLTTDIGESYTSREFFRLKVCLLTLFGKLKFSRNPDLQYQ